MSTKIWAAYRLKHPARLWDVVRDIKRIGRDNVRDELRKVYAAVMGDVDSNSREYKDCVGCGYDDWSARHSIAHDVIRRAYRGQLQSGERNPYHFDVSVGIWEHDGRMYLIPYCDMLMRDVLDFMKQDRRLADFRYWNNTDEPEDVSRRTWKKRGAVWDAIHEAGWDNHLVVNVCCWDNFYRIDPWADDATEHVRKVKTAKDSKT